MNYLFTEQYEDQNNFEKIRKSPKNLDNTAKGKKQNKKDYTKERQRKRSILE